MPLPIRPFRVTKNEPLADGCFLLGLAPNDGAEMFAFTAGQWVMVYLDDPQGGKPWRGAFSIASAPAQSREGCELAIKVYGDFTKRLQKCAVGDAVNIHGPFGIFTLRQDTRRMVMIAAGIGVTPFRSMMRQLAATNDPRGAVLIYTNKTRAETCFEDEFRAFVAEHPRMSVQFILTREAPDQWDGLTGRLDAEKLNALIPDVANSEFLMCGPEAFMNGMRDILVERGVDAKTHIRKERFD